MVVGTADGIVMIESGAKEVKEETVVDAIEFGHTEIKKICAAINELREKAGKTKRTVEPPEFDDAYYNDLKKQVGAELADALDTKKHPKAESYTLVKGHQEEAAGRDSRKTTKKRKTKLKHYYETLRERIFREQVIEQKRRPDARAFDEVREIWIEAGVLPRTHGSAIFTRGETQALVTTTLGTSDDMQRLEGFEGEAKKRFMLHYNFPPFSVGEVGIYARSGAARDWARSAGGAGGFGRAADGREVALRDARGVGHSGVERIVVDGDGLRRVIALMDAGVPLKAPVAGVAMGLVKEGDAVCHPDRHCGRGRSLRRHGLQSCRNEGRNHRAADGY